MVSDLGHRPGKGREECGVPAGIPMSGWTLLCPIRCSADIDNRLSLMHWFPAASPTILMPFLGSVSLSSFLCADIFENLNQFIEIVSNLFRNIFFCIN